jgi:hypothetical protein
MAEHRSRWRVDAQVDQCVRSCMECQNVCHTTIQHRLRQGGRYAKPEHLDLLRECAEACSRAAEAMVAGLPSTDERCRECTDICDRCAADCASFGDDPQMRACAQSCRATAMLCRMVAEAA